MLRFATMDVLHKIIIGKSIVAVGHHRGVDEMQEEGFHEGEAAIINTLSPRKRSEWLASRDLLFRISNLSQRVQCMYDDFGKPYLQGMDAQISVSHSQLWCAAMISDTPCGVDIQVYSETVKRISDRFLTPEDLLLVQKTKHPLHTLHLLWGAKECLYKAYGKKKLGFREHIFITSVDEANGTGLGEIRFEDIHLYYDIYFRMLPEVAWVFCLQHASFLSSPD